ncbi:MAG: CpaF family protein [Kiritimatiellia bacterium]
MGEDDLRKRAKEIVAGIVADVQEKLPPQITPADLAKEVYNEAVGLGPLEDLLADQSVTEIMVNGPNRIYVEKAGKLHATRANFVDDASVLAIIERIVSPIGRRIDESQPYVDARLPDGSRVNAIIAPLSLIGPCITIRKFSKDPFKASDLIRMGSVTQGTIDFLSACVKARKNIVVSGGTGTGKTTFLNLLSSFLPDDERIVTIEDAAELRLGQDHVIRLEARPPNIEGRGAIAIRDLVRNALRMRPDRIVVGECRSGEALDMLQAMNTGHEGSLTTVHANSPRDVISRLETMVLMAGMDLPVRAIREQIGAAIHLIVHLSRFQDGTRKVSRITEICGLEGDKITMQDLFEYKQTGFDDAGKVIGRLLPCGAVPTFMEEFRVRGIQLDGKIFDPLGSA